jgi:hypothetical protein
MFRSMKSFGDELDQRLDFLVVSELIEANR